jgi:anti-sigma factor RsiW
MPRAIEELLPFYANGSLELHERERVEAYLAEHPEAREELEFLGALRGSVRAANAVEGAGELERRRILKRIAPGASRARPWLGFALAASLGAIAVYGALSWSGSSSRGYQPLGSEAAIAVRLAPQTTEAQWRTLLLEADLTIVDGPSSAGIYRLAPADPERDPEAALDEALAILRSRPDLVVHVQAP